jgi:hypothetical protein
MIRRTLCVLVLAMTAGLAGAATSSADPTAQLNIEDSAVTLRDRPDAQAIINSWRNNLGVDSVRIQAFWDQISREGFGPLDRGIARIRAAGLEPLLTIHEKGPGFPAEPSPAAFAAFARQVASRYAGSVRMYTIGNEPNQGTFLTPQRKGGRPYSPHLYRRLVNAAYPAIKSADPSSFVLIGVMAPIGGTSPGANSVAPLLFLREMACVDRALRPVRTGNCAGFQPARGDGFAYHPYSIRYRLAPFQRNTFPDLANTGDIDKLFRILDPVTRAGRISKAGGGLFGVYFTEYGYETRPTDPRFGFPPEVQSRYLQEAAYIAWRTPRVKMMNQYLYFDDPDLFQAGSNVTFQTGLVYRGGNPKAALGSFPKPFYVDTRRPFSIARARIWGQVRPGGATSVTIEQSPNGSTWSALGTARTNFRGYFSRIGPVRRGFSYRFRFGAQTSDARRIP